MTIRTMLALGAAALTMAAPLAAADDVQAIAAKFGARETIQSISLSPGGTKVAVIVPLPGGEQLMVVDLAGSAALVPILNVTGDNDRLADCRWATEERMVCGAYYRQETEIGQLRFSRQFAVSADGSDVKVLSQENRMRALYAMTYGGGVIDWVVAGQPGRVLMERQYVPNETIGTNIASNKIGLGVEAVDVTTQKRSPVEPARAEASEYISDGQGLVRVMGMSPTDDRGYSKGVVNYLYRRQGSREWEKLSERKDAGSVYLGFNPFAVDSRENVVYGFERTDGFNGLYKVALDGSLKKDLVLARTDFDIDGLIQIGRTRRVVGASYATERRTTEFFDPELKRLRGMLAKAIPQHPIIEFVDATADEGKLLLFAGSDKNPGMFYLFDKASKKLSELLPLRPELAGLTFGEMTPITYAAADGTSIPGYLTLPAGSSGKGLPAIVMPHGQGTRDEWGFDWLAQFFVARGFAVLQPNFRGSSGYGSDWFQKNGFQSWKTAIGDVNAAGRWLQTQGIAAPGKLAIFGWSYGGYAALQSAALDPDLFKAIVAVASVTDLDRFREEKRNHSNFPQFDKYIGQGPHIREGSPAQNAGAIRAPVLLFHGDKDVNVGVGQSKLMADKLRGAGKSVEFVEFPGLDHQLDDAAARTRMLSQSDAFLRKALGL